MRFNVSRKEAQEAFIAGAEVSHKSWSGYLRRDDVTGCGVFTMDALSACDPYYISKLFCESPDNGFRFSGNNWMIKEGGDDD